MTTLSEAMKGNDNAAKDHATLPQGRLYVPGPFKSYGLIPSQSGLGGPNQGRGNVNPPNVTTSLDRKQTLENIKAYLKNTYESARKTAKESWGNVSTKSMETWDKNDKTVKYTLGGAAIGAIAGSGLGTVVGAVVGTTDAAMNSIQRKYYNKKLDKIYKELTGPSPKNLAFTKEIVEGEKLKVKSDLLKVEGNVLTYRIPKGLEKAYYVPKGAPKTYQKIATDISLKDEEPFLRASKKLHKIPATTSATFLRPIGVAMALNASVGAAMGGYAGFKEGRKLDLLEEQQKRDAKYLKATKRLNR